MPEISSSACLTLADGACWRLEGEGRWAGQLVAGLARVMQLPTGDGRGRLLRLRPGDDMREPGAGYQAAQRFPQVVWPASDVEPVECLIDPQPGAHALLVFMEVARVIAQDAQARGGVLLHAALAEREGAGIVLVGPSGMGKTTTSQRLPPPWQARCDDAVLVVRDREGVYWAHPWPTWSRFAFNGPGGSWQVPVASRLRAIFCLSQAGRDWVEPIGPGQALQLLTGLSEVTGQMPRSSGAVLEEGRRLRLQRFDNLSQLVRTLPVYVLHLSREGAFWNEIERVLDSR